jgi:hypothetical protein
MAGRILRPYALGSLRADDLRRRDYPRQRRPAGGLVFLSATGIVGLAAASSLFAGCFSLLTRPAASMRPAIPIATPIRAEPPRGPANPPPVVEPSALLPPVTAVIERSPLPPPAPYASRAAAGLPRARATRSAGDSVQAVKRGEAALPDGDLGVARFRFQQAADAGDGAAALRMGETFDPAFWAHNRRRSDARAARHWYLRALDLGAAEAARRLARLDSAANR